IGRPYVSQNIEGLNAVPIPLLSAIPVIGPIVFNHDLLTYFGYLLGPLIWLFLYRTRWGLSLRAVGESTAVAFSTGRNPARTQYAAVFFGGMMAGLGGAQLSLALTQTWVEGMTSGYGFIGVALVIFAMWQPLRAMLGAFIFGGAVALQFQLQSMGVQIPPYFLLMLPYLLTLAILLIFGQKNRYAAPAWRQCSSGRARHAPRRGTKSHKGLQIRNHASRIKNHASSTVHSPPSIVV